MSEENSFGAVAIQAPAEAVAADEVSGRSSRALLIAGGVAIAVLAVFAYLLFFRGGGEPEATGVVVIGGGPAAVAPETPDEAVTVKKTKVTNVKGTNPFVPIEVEAVDTGGADTAANTTTDTTATDTTTNPEAGTTGGTAPPPATSPSGQTVTVKLVSVKGDLVATKVGTVNYTGLAPGDTFGTNFQVYAIFNNSCAGFLYGDESFALCEGKSVTLPKS